MAIMKQIQIIELAREIVPNQTLLSTRVYGKKMAEALLKALYSTNTVTVVALSFEGIELMDGSFADEVFGTLAAGRSRRIMEGAPLYLINLEPTSLDNLDMALNNRILRDAASIDKLRNCVIPVMTDSGELKLVGKTEEHVKQTFELLGHHTTLSARQLAEEMNLNINAASTRLKVLADLGLALRNELRDEQGKLYLYQSLV